MKLKDALMETSLGEDYSRRDLLTKAAKGAILVAAAVAIPGCGGSGNNSSAPPTGGSATVDTAVLQFALNLEYLEAEFYTYATTGQSITAQGVAITGIGTPGATTGGVKTTFTDPRLAAIAAEIANDERQHVILERGALGANVVAKPALNLAALGSFATQSQFLALARAFEDTGVSAYAGAAPLLSPTALAVAARILAAEAYHASNIRLEVALDNVTTTATDNQDILPPPSGQSYFALNAQGLCVIRTPAQVLNIVYAGGSTKGGFFPNGGNLSAASVTALGL